MKRKELIDFCYGIKEHKDIEALKNILLRLKNEGEWYEEQLINSYKNMNDTIKEHINNMDYEDFYHLDNSTRHIKQYILELHNIQFKIKIIEEQINNITK